MYGTKTFRELEERGGSLLFIDVRSPGEFHKEHIPGAMNLPVMDDQTRREVGILYKEKKYDEAKIRGLSYMGDHLEETGRTVLQWIAQWDHVVLYCSRGGFRSSSLFSLLRSLDIPVEKLDGGYKEYRRHVREELPLLNEKARYAVLDGLTGCGKTEILKELEALGAAIMDIEGAANHRGSLLGNIGLGEQPSQKMFESHLYDALKKGQHSVIFTEGESIRLGARVIPKDIHEKIRRSPRIRITDTLDRRARRLAEEYTKNICKEELLQGVERLRPWMEGEKLQWCKEAIEAGEIHKATILLMEEYYDKKYRLDQQPVLTLPRDEHSAQRLIQWAGEQR